MFCVSEIEADMKMKYKDIELRDDNLLRAVVEGTNANAHLVAYNGLMQGIHETAEQYHIHYEKVISALKFYLDNREEIDQLNDAAFGQAGARDGYEFLEELKRRKVIE